ncbi:MAG TPA: aldehyde dehydrogenase family protein, partial [Solirubrobacteraceae bacterium]|nr:aldehyde dehydrogenase family protein [Solirubrobacteraceae bacterium]
MSDTAISTRTAASIVDGVARTDAPGGRLESTNPANLSDVVAEVLLTDAQGFEDACRAARAAQRGWAAVPAPARGRVIAEVGRLFEANKEALARLVTREIGKPYPEALGEVQEIIDTCDFFLGEGRRLYGQTVPSEMPDKQLFTFRMPVGVAAIVTAGNFPGAVPSWYLVPAILCGNAVVWKPAEYSAAIASAMTQIFHAGGVPKGVLNLVQADGAQTFAGLERALEQRLVDKVGFTGSSAVGAEIGALCGRHLQSPCLELGGKNPMVVMDDADLDLAVEGALFAGFGTAGQRCTSLGTAIVQASVHDEFVRRLDERLRAAPIGDPMADVLYGPMLHERFAERFEEWLGLIRPHHVPHGSTAQGRITSAAPRAGFVGDPEAGIFYHPTFVSGVTIEDEIYGTE